LADSYLTIINVVWIKLYIAAIGEQVRIWIKVEERKKRWDEIGERLRE